MRLGLLMGGAGPLNAPIFRAFRAANPGVSLSIVEVPTTHILGPLVSNDLDAVLVWGPLNDPRVALTALFTDPRVLVLGETNPLADATTLVVDDVLDERHGIRVPGEPDEWEAFWNLVPERNGAEPERVAVMQNGDVNHQLHAIGMTNLALSVPASMAEAFPANRYGVRYVPVVGLSPAICSIAVRRDNPGPLALMLRDAAVAVSSERSGLLVAPIPG